MKKMMMKMKSNMYEDAKTCNPFKGCKFDCSYCKPSFQLQAKRQKHNCDDCYRYEPHEHPERLAHIPKAPIVFVCGNGDIAFCPAAFLRKIIEAIKIRNRKDEKKGYSRVYYLQTKRPEYLSDFVSELPPNVVLVTTLETNRDEGYELVSKAPPPSERYQQFLALNWPRKIVTIEPVMDFDLHVFLGRILTIKPECVWFGFNSRVTGLAFPEPTEERAQFFVNSLVRNGIKVRGKSLRGVKLNKDEDHHGEPK